eukprot:TRINITY_DN1208_c0_g1_i3.p1 TRINITY_DN1208_c0_g1~~TRINITY_DN1208_c0_g1_i3.p1  ORF type:complete len:330 (+),score=53.25 TRINITY_DN1208_c0_g1_i3:24-1013(+)
MSVRCGLDNVVLRQGGHAQAWLTGSATRVGLLTNASGRERGLARGTAAALRACGVAVAALFAPEHGIASAVQDATHVGYMVDKATGLPVYSLYDAHTREPSSEQLSKVDVVLCDIQDVGVRFYTFVWTLCHLIQAAGKAGVRVVVLDRPNPLGGTSVRGPLLLPKFASFVGRYPICLQHGMTMGEIAKMMNERWNPTPAQLEVVRCSGWSRDMRWNETGLMWVPPSPNMPHVSTVEHYPGSCFIEGTTLSEGRGTALPFEVTGAPWIDGEQLAAELNAETVLRENYGAAFRPHCFTPQSSKWANTACEGIFLPKHRSLCVRRASTYRGQ